MKTKKLAIGLLSLLLAFGVGLAGCNGNNGGSSDGNNGTNQGNDNQGDNNQGNNNQGNDNQGNNNQGNDNQGNDNQGNDNQGGDNQGNDNQGGDNQGNDNEENKEETSKTTIYLAGDSTVKTYADDQYIGGWGQFLAEFLDGDKVEVINAAEGGRSSRSFINEGRLFNMKSGAHAESNFNYSFSQNGGKSIEETIKTGDFLFIQFGHNDDSTKMASKPESNYTTVYDRMVPLGTPDSSGNYPVTPAVKVATTELPETYTDYATDAQVSTAKTTTAKYGDTYYSYDSGTYKWYLKQYIDFAREAGATPVLVTPVARVSFNGASLKSGPGLHGDDFAYVKAVRQLAEEEDCLLVDLFDHTKTLLETATASYANYLMALKSNELKGSWPAGYDMTYNNAALGYEGIEATHYNKYGAYLTAARVAEVISSETKTGNKGAESYTFKDAVKSTPAHYVAPSNLLTKPKISALEGVLTGVNVTDPERKFPDPEPLVVRIFNELKNEVTADNCTAYKAVCEDLRLAYACINVDDRSKVTNINKLAQREQEIKDMLASLRPVATSTKVINANNITDESITTEKSYTSADGTGFKLVGESDKAVTIIASNKSYTFLNQQYTVSKYVNLGGGATFGTSRYIEFETTGKCKVTVVANSGADDRVLNLVSKDNTSAVLTTFAAPKTVTVTEQDIEQAGTYQLGSKSSGIYVLAIIIEYFE